MSRLDWLTSSLEPDVSTGSAPKVEYLLSKAGESLKPLIKAMQAWGDEHLLSTNKPISAGQGIG